MITKNQFREAMIIVETYCNQIENGNGPCHIIGCPVQLSEYGIRINKENKGKIPKIGKVVDWLEWHSLTDGLVTIKWEGVKKPDIRHISQVEAIKK